MIFQNKHVLVKLDFKLYTGTVLIYSIIINSQYNINNLDVVTLFDIYS